MALKIGFTNKFFTIWDVTRHTQHTDIGSYDKVTSTYIQNLSFEEDKAIEKAKEFGCTNLQVDESLRGVSRSFSHIENEQFDITKFQIGKYRGDLICENTDVDYLVWYNGNSAGSHDHQKLIIDRILELTDEYVLNENGDLITKELAKNIENVKAILAKDTIKGIAIKNISDPNYFPRITIELENGDQHKFYIDQKKQPIKVMDYRGFEYGLPLIGDKAKRIKNKELILTLGTFKDYNDEDIRGVISIDLVK